MMNERNINIDIVKFLAVFFVVSVHFFLNNKFYLTVIDNPEMYIMAGMRTFFMMCVPLFLLTTGYLMNKKELSLKYYSGFKKILLPYIIISIITYIAKITFSPEIFPIENFSQHINNIISFKLVKYAWYVEMYIGLFLLIPFINKLFTNKKNDLILVLTLAFLTILPCCSDSIFKIKQWEELWPVTYYVIGAYISRYEINIPKIKLIYSYVLFLTGFIFINILMVNNSVWNVGKIDDWGGIENTITSTLFFIIILKTNFENLKPKIKSFITDVSKLTLGIYLSSYLFDQIIYHYFNILIPETPAKLKYYPLIVLIVFIFSYLLAKLTDINTYRKNKNIT